MSSAYDRRRNQRRTSFVTANLHDMLRRSSSLTFQPKASSVVSTSLTLVENSEDLSYVKHQLQYSIFIRIVSILLCRIQRPVFKPPFFLT